MKREVLDVKSQNYNNERQFYLNLCGGGCGGCGGGRGGRRLQPRPFTYELDSGRGARVHLAAAPSLHHTYRLGSEISPKHTIIISNLLEIINESLVTIKKWLIFIKNMLFSTSSQNPSLNISRCTIGYDTFTIFTYVNAHDVNAFFYLSFGGVRSLLIDLKEMTSSRQRAPPARSS